MTFQGFYWWPKWKVTLGVLVYFSDSSNDGVLNRSWRPEPISIIILRLAISSSSLRKKYWGKNVARFQTKRWNVSRSRRSFWGPGLLNTAMCICWRNGFCASKISLKTYSIWLIMSLGRFPITNSIPSRKGRVIRFVLVVAPLSSISISGARSCTVDPHSRHPIYKRRSPSHLLGSWILFPIVQNFKVGNKLLKHIRQKGPQHHK